MTFRIAPRLIRATVFVAFALGGGLAASVAAAEAIQCPYAKVKRQIVTPIPSGWWTTPVQQNLQTTKIAVVGGKKTLICDYGHAGSIMRLPPAGHNCQAIHTGFQCQAAYSAPQTYSTKKLKIPQTWTADLDQGHVGGNGADIWFQAKTSTDLWITPRNGAWLSVSGNRNRGYDGCRNASWTKHSVNLWDIPVGTYVCVKTNQGRISEFRMNHISGGSPKNLTIGYTTWR